MSAQFQNLTIRQRGRMRELCDAARDIAKTVAVAAWGKFEIEIEETTADS